jgi:hypothetical protein
MASFYLFGAESLLEGLLIERFRMHTRGRPGADAFELFELRD